jgi:hypothetical protein
LYILIASYPQHNTPHHTTPHHTDLLLGVLLLLEALLPGLSLDAAASALECRSFNGWQIKDGLTIILLPCMYHWVTQQCRNYLAYFATSRPASRLLCNVQGHASSHNNELKGRKTNKHTYVCTNLQTKISFEKIFILQLLSS